MILENEMIMPNNKNQTINDEIQGHTIHHYNVNAESFWQGTRDHDVSQNINAFLNAMPKGCALDILDFGCGPGRDLIAFKQLGHRPIGLDGSEAFCRMAQQRSACKVLHQQFLNLDLAPASFDGIFANASMFHIPSQELSQVLATCHNALKPQGILFTSNPRGNAEGWQGDRYGHYMELEKSQLYLEQAGFSILDHYYRPHGKPRHEQPWLAIVSQRS
jgi:SAM-dependent methyltransferase